MSSHSSQTVGHSRGCRMHKLMLGAIALLPLFFAATPRGLTANAANWRSPSLDNAETPQEWIYAMTTRGEKTEECRWLGICD